MVNSSSGPAIPFALKAFALFSLPAALAAQGIGVSTQAVSGGLVIPSAQVLEEGTLAFTAGNYSEPQLGDFARRRNLSLGVGLLPNVELFGRFADFQNPVPGATINGPRDISANLKIQLPPFWRSAPKVAVGVNDVGGGAVFFKSFYGVVSDQYGPFKWSAGYAYGRPILGNTAQGYAFKGAFAGAELSLGTPHLTLLAEYDGQQKHAGLRFYSAPVPWLGQAQVVGTLQRSFGAADMAGRDQDRTSLAVSLLVPLGQNAQRATAFKPDKGLPPLEVDKAAGMTATAQDRLDALLRAVAKAGLERVRVGTVGNDLLIEYENHRFGQSEADAIGVVLGLGAEFAPNGVQRVHAVTHQAGLRVYEVSVGVAEYRNFLRHGEARFANGSLSVDRAPTYLADRVTWINATPTHRSPLRVELGPDLNHTIGTEVGAFDYSVAANLKGIVPLWRGAELYTSYIQRLANTGNFEPDAVFAASRQRNGLKVAAVHQSFWLGSHVLANVGVGRYNYDSAGLQGESTVFIPGRDDVLRLKAGLYERQPGQSRNQAMPASASYRWVHSPTTWVEAGLQQYSDGSSGPSVVLTRWFGDVAAQLFYRKGGGRQFAGLEMSIPLTLRRGMEPGAVTFSGTPEFTTGVRTRLARGSTTSNTVQPGAVRDFQLDYDAEARQLNRGRVSEKFFISQIHRMREAFFLYARDLLPQ